MVDIYWLFMKWFWTFILFIFYIIISSTLTFLTIFNSYSGMWIFQFDEIKKRLIYKYYFNFVRLILLISNLAKTDKISSFYNITKCFKIIIVVIISYSLLQKWPLNNILLQPCFHTFFNLYSWIGWKVPIKVFNLFW